MRRVPRDLSAMPSTPRTLRSDGNGTIWIDHGSLSESDLELIKNVRRLTLWSVDVAPGLLAKLPELWWIDWRGGPTRNGVSQIGDCEALRFLAIHHVRDLTNLGFLDHLKRLEFLSLYGLPKLSSIPSLENLTRLRRIELGQLKSLPSLSNILAAENIEEIVLADFVNVTDEDIALMQNHPALSAFEWHHFNSPLKLSKPLREALALPAAPVLHPQEWFGSEG